MGARHREAGDPPADQRQGLVSDFRAPVRCAAQPSSHPTRASASASVNNSALAMGPSRWKNVTTDGPRRSSQRSQSPQVGEYRNDLIAAARIAERGPRTFRRPSSGTLLAIHECFSFTGWLGFRVRRPQVWSGSAWSCSAVPLWAGRLFALRASLPTGGERACFAFFARSVPAVATVFLSQVRLKAGHLPPTPLEPDLAHVPREGVGELLALEHHR